MNRTALVLSAALLASTAFAQPDLAEPFADGTWTLVRLDDASGSVTPTGDAAPTLSLVGTRFSTAEGPRVSGSAGCNTFTGTGVFTASTVRLGPLATTRRLCDPARNALETRFLNVLSRVRGLSFSRNLLILSTGTQRLVFSNRVTALDQTRLFASWRLVGAVGDTPPSLTLSADGRVSGSTGCNNLTGSFTLDGAGLRFSPLATTRRACLSPELQTQESTFLERLALVRSFSVSGSVLTLTLEGGETLTFQRPVN